MSERGHMVSEHIIEFGGGRKGLDQSEKDWDRHTERCRCVGVFSCHLHIFFSFKSSPSALSNSSFKKSDHPTSQNRFLVLILIYSRQRRCQIFNREEGERKTWWETGREKGLTTKEKVTAQITWRKLNTLQAVCLMLPIE